MATLDNPAGMLHDVLVRIKKSKPSDGAAMRTIWSHTFGIEPGDLPGVISIWMNLLKLVDQTRSCIHLLDDCNQELILRPVDQVHIYLSVALPDTRWIDCRRMIDDQILYGLEIASDRLSRNMKQEVLDDRILDELRREVERMTESVLTMEVAIHLKRVLLNHLAAIRQAIIEYRIRGTQGLRDALDSGIGSLLRHQKELKAVDDIGGRIKVRWFFDLLVRIDDYVTGGTIRGLLATNGFEQLQLTDQSTN